MSTLLYSSRSFAACHRASSRRPATKQHLNSIPRTAHCAPCISSNNSIPRAPVVQLLVRHNQQFGVCRSVEHGQHSNSSSSSSSSGHSQNGAADHAVPSHGKHRQQYSNGASDGSETTDEE